MIEVPEYIDNHLFVSSVKNTNYDAQRPEAFQTQSVTETYKEMIETENFNRGKVEKQVNHPYSETLIRDTLRVTDPVQLPDKGTEIYTDKSIAEVMHPKLVSFEESTYQVVKDISVDVGRPCSNKKFIGDGKKIRKTLGDFLISGKDASKNLFKLEDGLASFDGEVDLEDKFYAVKQCENLVRENGFTFEQDNHIGDIISKDSTPEIMLATEGSDAKTILLDSDRPEGATDEQLSTQTLNSNEIPTSTGQSTSNEFRKESKESNKNAFSCEKSLGIAVSDRESPPLEVSGRELGTESADSKVQPHESYTMPNLDDDIFDGLAGSSRSLFIQHGLGESSFSRTDDLPGSISHSSHIPYSASISLRSDSSSGSFAFPILAAEWSTSPVKMAKADRTRFRKHSCWRVPFLCCRFCSNPFQ